MKSRFLLGISSKIFLVVIPALAGFAIVGEISPEDVAKIIVIPVLITILSLSVVGALKVIRNNRNES